ncbi:MAG: T9SS type A sorting domain-containing protein [Bacteroidota bacterium]
MKIHARSALAIVAALSALSLKSYAQWELANCGITGDVRSLATNSTAVFAATLDGVFRSCDDGESWDLFSSPLPVEAGGQLGMFVASETHLFFACGHAFVSEIGGGCWRYSEEGLTGNLIPELYKLVGSVALSGTKVLIGTAGGLFASTDVGYTWNLIRFNGAEIWGLEASGTEVYASTRGGYAHYSSDGGVAWSRTGPGLPEFQDPEGVLGFAFCGEYVFAFTAFHGPYLSTDPAGPWVPANSGLPIGRYRTYSVTGNSFGYFAGSQDGVFRSFDGFHWEPCGEGLPPGAEIGGWGNQGLVMSGEHLLALVKDSTGQKVWRRAVADALPIRLVMFTATSVAGRGVDLRWNTASETNNFGFEVQKTAWPPAYQSIPGAFLPGQGTTLVPQEYAWTDPTGTAGEYYRLKQIDLDGTVHYSEGVRAAYVTGVENQSPAPKAYALHQNYPNPFNPCTNIRYALPSRGHVTLVMLDALGQHVATLVDGIQDAGEHEVRFDGSGLASGVYFYQLNAGEYMETRRLMLLR